MSKEIQEFIEKLKDWKNNFPVQDYDYTKYDCEVANIAKWQKENNINELINFWNEKIKEEYFELKHPICNDVVTRAIWSCNLDNLLNWIFFVDIKNKNPFFLGQVCSCVNFMFVQNNFMILDEGWDNLYIDTASILSDFVRKNYPNLEHLDLKYKAAHFGFTLQNERPVHFFAHFLNNFIFLKNKKKVFSQNVYFKPKYALFDKRDDIVYFYPTTKMNANLNKMYAYVLQESLEDYHILTDKDQLKQEYDLTIWLGLPGERRAWLEQIEGTANILKYFNKYFKKIKVYVDGMTAYDGERQDFPENKVLFNKVVDATRKLFLEEYDKNIIFAFEDLQDSASSLANEERFVVFKSLAGYDYRTKICYCNDCDIAISDSGTTTLVPFQFHQKPGVVFYGELASFYINFSKSLADNAYQRAVDEKLVVQVNRKSFLVWDYHIPYQHIYNLAAEVLEELSRDNKLKVKNLKMHRLKVPPVELIAKQYELEKQFEVKIPLENVEFVDKLATQLQQKDQIIQAKNQEITSKNQELTQTKNQLDSTEQQLDSKVKELDSKTKELSTLPIKKQTLEIKNLEQDLINKQLHTKKLEKELGYESNVLQELELKNQELIQTKNQLDFTKKQLDLKNQELSLKNQQLNSKTKELNFTLRYGTAKDRIHNHLSYKLGQ
ncbi:MAG: hypothetical protein MR955_02485, partial [Helicobacter sp.]|nr:hypothetical protein [Helicobacter sp.]